MDTICSSHKSLYRDFLSTRPTRLGEPPPVSLLLWSRGGLVIGIVHSMTTGKITNFVLNDDKAKQQG